MARQRALLKERRMETEKAMKKEHRKVTEKGDPMDIPMESSTERQRETEREDQKETQTGTRMEHQRAIPKERTMVQLKDGPHKCPCSHCSTHSRKCRLCSANRQHFQDQRIHIRRLYHLACIHSSLHCSCKFLGNSSCCLFRK